MIREFEVFIDIVNPKTNKLVVKSAICKKTFNTDEIKVEQCFNDKGKLVKKHCFIYEGEKIFKANHTYEYVKKLTEPVQIIGLIGKSKIYKNGKSKS